MSSIEALSRPKKIVVLLMAIAFFAALIITCLELTSYFLLSTIYKVKHSNSLSLAEYVISKPLAFKNAEDFEEIKLLWSEKTDCPQNRIISNSTIDFPMYEDRNVFCNGPETISNGLRTTVEVPKESDKKILFFGGSTVWGTGSADRNTIPSLVQIKLNESGRNYAVQNHGFSTVVISQQLRLLKSLDISKGDIVIFYDGGNDVWNSVVSGNPNGSIIGYNERNLFEIILNRSRFFLSIHSNTYKLLGAVKSGRNQNGSNSCLKLEEGVVRKRADAGFEVYYQSALDAKHYVEEREGIFFHFMQPTLVSSLPLSNDEYDLINAMPMEMKCGIDVYQSGYEIYKNKYKATKSAINGVDLSNFLHGPKNDGAYFFDYIHISSPGNKIIAEQIYQKIPDDH